MPIFGWRLFLNIDSMIRWVYATQSTHKITNCSVIAEHQSEALQEQLEIVRLKIEMDLTVINLSESINDIRHRSIKVCRHFRNQ